MFGIATWLSRYDEFGSYAKFNYRGESGYGTGIGGCCSLIVYWMVALFVFMQLWAFAFKPQWNSATTVNYLDSKIGEKVDAYEIEVGDLMPTFTISTHYQDGTESLISNNDRSLFDFYYTQNEKQYDHSFDDFSNTSKEQLQNQKTRYEAILCVDYINGPKWASKTQDQRDSALSQIISKKLELCPDIDTFVLEGGLMGKKSFQFRVEAVGGTSPDLINDTQVLSSMITRYYTPSI